MPRLVLPLALAALLLAAIAPVQAQTQDLPNPLGLRGYNLGMTLDEVRKLRHPDADVQKGNGKIGLACPGDPIVIPIDPGYAEFQPTGEPCRFYIDNKDGPRELPMNVGGRDAMVTLHFTPKTWPAATAARLYRIQVIADPAHFNDLAEAYRSKFGKPLIDEKVDEYSRVIIWMDDYRNLALVERMKWKGLPLGRTGIRYEDIALEKAVNAAKRKLKPGADKL
jgi:hypothetical protein